MFANIIGLCFWGVMLGFVKTPGQAAYVMGSLLLASWLAFREAKTDAGTD